MRINAIAWRETLGSPANRRASPYRIQSTCRSGEQSDIEDFVPIPARAWPIGKCVT
jgi:hypothetical protein